MDFSIASILMLDGATNGAIYALLGLATVLVFAITRVIFIPQGEFVAYGALTLALLQMGKVPGTVWLLVAMAVMLTLMTVAMPVWRQQQKRERAAGAHHPVLGVPFPVGWFGEYSASCGPSRSRSA